MQTTITETPVEVSNRLEQLGWTETELLEIVHAMVAGRNSCTANDPVSAPGWMAWKDGTRRTRELGAMKGWRRIDIDQVPWILDVELGRKFTVVNSNDAAGIRGRDPQNRSKKGTGTERTVFANADQLNLKFPDMPADDQDDVLADRAFGYVSWYLFVYSEDDIVRAELSCPVGISNGFFSKFSERIFLRTANFTPPTDESLTHDTYSEFEISVERLVTK
ncbi:hypothetical protein [Xanthomonas arboricola]|uniref:hypothetical protein n=1 Tax=Xanthomonas arboricola TaxID=56448 RepID=UPI0011B0DC50|nr:hypothetical protein [Xanthomonas arboricola]